MTNKWVEEEIRLMKQRGVAFVHTETLGNSTTHQHIDYFAAELWIRDTLTAALAEGARQHMDEEAIRNGKPIK